MWCYLTGIAGAIAADQYLGKYKAILLFANCYLVGLIVLVVTSFPACISAGIALPGLIVAMFIIGIGTGGIKSNVAPLIAEQVTNEGPYTKVLRTGEKVLIDPYLTVQRIYMIFYLCINIGSLSGIITTSLEHGSGFWAAYLLALCFFVIGVVVLVLGRKMYVVRPPKGSIVADSFKVVYMAFQSKCGIEVAKPSIRQAFGLSTVPWDDSFVDEVQKALRACKVLLFFPIYYAVYFQMMNNFVSQAGTMELNGIPVSPASIQTSISISHHPRTTSCKISIPSPSSSSSPSSTASSTLISAHAASPSAP
jgi:POT family proton-dependent oligopeptide transporter